MRIALDFTSGAPIYRQIVDQIKYLVVSGRLKPGDRIPSVRELAEEIKVNPTTIMKVYAELTRDGAIYQRRGLGCFIAESVSKFSETEIHRIVDEKTAALVVEASHLGLSKAAILARVEKIYNEIVGEKP